MGALDAVDRFLAARVTFHPDAVLAALGGFVRWLLGFALVVYGTAVFAAILDGGLQSTCGAIFGCDPAGSNHICGRCRSSFLRV